MDSVKLNNEELNQLILFGCQENGLDIEKVRPFKVKSIINNYVKLCDVFQASYIVGELDTFKRAACLLVAINRGSLSKDKKINASIALDTAYKMCEKPYWNVGDNFDVPKKLEEVNFKECFQKDIATYNESKGMLIDALVYENVEPLSCYLNLEMFYQIALKLKHERLSDEEQPDEIFNDGLIEGSVIEEKGIQKLIRRFRSSKNSKN